jgi:glycine cleavage system protein P-like pyridoxal-binding family
MTVETALQLTLGSSTLKSNAKSNNIVTTQKPTGYLRPYGRPPDGPATHTHLHGSLW